MKGGSWRKPVGNEAMYAPFRNDRTSAP